MGEMQAGPGDKQADTQGVRQSARRVALDAQDKVKKRRLERDKRLSALGIQVAVALGERDAAVARCERRAGAALRAMTDDEGLALVQAVLWCGEGLTRREASRLRAVHASASESATAAPEPQLPANVTSPD
ncbi:hypothetical protein [Lapillicoccus sp.]|uniref:hypothetical protein n=1 Tax=Lapillicoccus sp. TaxID=1909287 RepID=UPI0025EFC813|nr:hypothetical protein [Lapillicoccus sp.]